MKGESEAFASRAQRSVPGMRKVTLDYLKCFGRVEGGNRRKFAELL